MSLNYGHGHGYPPPPGLPPHPAQRPRRSTGRTALVVVGSFLGVIVLLVAAVAFVVNGTRSDWTVAWKVDWPSGGANRPQQENDDVQWYVTEDALVRIGRHAVTSFDRGTGKQAIKRTFEESAPVCAAADRLTGNVAVLLTSNDGLCNRLTAVDVTTGRVGWTATLATAENVNDNHLGTIFFVHVSGDIMLATSGRGAIAVDVTSGKTRWQAKLTRSCTALDVNADDHTLLFTAECYGKDADDDAGYLIAFDVASGEERRTTYRRGDITPEPLIAQVTPPALVEFTGVLRLFDEDGKHREDVPLRVEGSRKLGETTVADGKLVAEFFEAERAAAYDLTTGKQQWERKLDPEGFVEGADGDTATAVERKGIFTPPRLTSLSTASGDVRDRTNLPSQANLYPAQLRFAGDNLVVVADSSDASSDMPWITVYRPR